MFGDGQRPPLYDGSEPTKRQDTASERGPVKEGKRRIRSDPFSLNTKDGRPTYPLSVTDPQRETTFPNDPT